VDGKSRTVSLIGEFVLGRGEEIRRGKGDTTSYNPVLRERRGIARTGTAIFTASFTRRTERPQKGGFHREVEEARGETR